ncbi:MAG TPA: PAS domain S-box protein [Gaiellaceae bacterium]
MTAVLLVDDRRQNLVALEAILEPLGHELVSVLSGQEALRTLLQREDFAAILLDVQMPGLDGFETATLIKQRERTRDIPIVFLTAISKERQHVFRGYEVGAVDYVFKPFQPEILRSKVAVLVDLHVKTEQLRQQAELLALQGMAELRRESAARYRQLADAMPQIVWTADVRGRPTYFNRGFIEYTGLSARERGADVWQHLVHPEDREDMLSRQRRALESVEVFEAEYRIRAADGSYRWHLGRAVPMANPDGGAEFWIGTATDIHDRKRIEEGQGFLLDAGVELLRTLDVEVALREVANLAVPVLCDACEFDLEDTSLSEDELTPERIRVALVSYGRTLGSFTLRAEEGRHFDETDLDLARALAQRGALAVESARLYTEAERRARASRALETIADGVVLLDREGCVLLWNVAAERITGLAAADVVGRRASEAIPGYARFAERVPADGSRPETVPIEHEGRELWLSFSAVEFDEGTVYTFRDLTEERALEQLRSNLVATVSHELRTPLAAIYGAAVTVRRPDIDVGAEMSDRLLEIIEAESNRLVEIVNDLLLASHLDSGRLQLAIDTVDARALTTSVVEAARTHLPEGITLTLASARKLPPVQADEQQLRQVLVNLVDNAVKYSPEGGPVTVTVGESEDYVLWTVSDQGLGIPPAERRRVFEKFYRLDPNMTRGIGGTGLGLYICRELVSRHDGRIWVEANNGRGSKFCVEIPVATTTVPARQSVTSV